MEPEDFAADCMCLKLLREARETQQRFLTEQEREETKQNGKDFAKLMIDSYRESQRKYREFAEDEAKGRMASQKRWDDTSCEKDYCCPNTLPERAPKKDSEIPKSFYEAKAKLIDGTEVCMEELAKGKVTIVVNTASYCGLTIGEYTQMNEVIDQFDRDKLCVLAFPCNQFCFEENTAGQEILNALKHVRPGKGFVPKATMMDKVDVNGFETAPVYEYLKRQIPCSEDEPFHIIRNEAMLLWDPIYRFDVASNFEKFVIDCNGKVVHRYSPIYQFKYLVDDICELLGMPRPKKRCDSVEVLKEPTVLESDDSSDDSGRSSSASSIGSEGTESKAEPVAADDTTAAPTSKDSASMDAEAMDASSIPSPMDADEGDLVASDGQQALLAGSSSQAFSVDPAEQVAEENVTLMDVTEPARTHVESSIPFGTAHTVSSHVGYVPATFSCSYVPVCSSLMVNHSCVGGVENFAGPQCAPATSFGHQRCNLVDTASRMFGHQQTTMSTTSHFDANDNLRRGAAIRADDMEGTPSSRVRCCGRDSSRHLETAMAVDHERRALSRQRGQPSAEELRVDCCSQPVCQLLGQSAMYREDQGSATFGASTNGITGVRLHDDSHHAARHLPQRPAGPLSRHVSRPNHADHVAHRHNHNTVGVRQENSAALGMLRSGESSTVGGRKRALDSMLNSEPVQPNTSRRSASFVDHQPHSRRHVLRHQGRRGTQSQ